MWMVLHGVEVEGREIWAHICKHSTTGVIQRSSMLLHSRKYANISCMTTWEWNGLYMYVMGDGKIGLDNF